MNTNILKVLVGSRAHGLAKPESDFDYRGVFVTPTSDLLKLGGQKNRTTNWIEGEVDDTAWEIGHFLHLATKCNPTILEAFLAPVVGEVSEEGQALRALFHRVWNSADVMNAFIGYGLNQRKKFLENKDGRACKYAAAYLRSLYNAHELLTTGTFTVEIALTPIGEKVRDYKEGRLEVGEVISTCFIWERSVREAYAMNPDKKTDLEAVNKFLLDIRLKHW